MTRPAPPSQDTREREKKARFRQLFDMHYDYVYHSLRRLGVHQRDLEDVSHDVFMAVYGKLDVLDPARSPRPWACRSIERVFRG